MLAGLSADQLRAGIARGRSQLLLLDAFNNIDPSDDFDGPFPATKTFEQWEANFDERRRYLLNLGSVIANAN